MVTLNEKFYFNECSMILFWFMTLFSEIENLINEKIPTDIKLILEECAFDTELSLLALDDKVVSDIESHVNSDRELLRNTSYENVNHFKFKPGHKIFLLQMPNYIKT